MADNHYPETCRHLGDGVYATWTGFSMEIRVNDHRSAVVAELEPLAVRGLLAFMEQHQVAAAEARLSQEAP